jgi:hypothetical protein
MQLTFLSEAPPANPTASPDSARGLMILVATSPLPTLQLLADIAPRGSLGRMSSASFQATEDELLQAFWDSSPVDGSRSPPAGGKLRDLSTATKALTASHGACLTLNMSEHTGLDGLSLKDEGVSSLSDILEIGDVPRRFFLSAKACQGILRRAEKRRKTLPGKLAQALKAAAASGIEGLDEESTED